MDLDPIKDYVIERLSYLSKEGDAQGCLCLMEEFSEWLEETDDSIVTLSSEERD
tara:strand:+ start:223 stop:384 length:162 start_codon:yes stop_codon:yes gene_type:complete